MFNFFKKMHELFTKFLCEYEMKKNNNVIEQEIIQEIDDNFTKFEFKNKMNSQQKQTKVQKKRLNQSDNIIILQHIIVKYKEPSEEEIKKICLLINKPEDTIRRRIKKLLNEFKKAKENI